MHRRLRARANVTAASILIVFLASSAAFRPTQTPAPASVCDVIGAVCFRDTAYAHTYPGDANPIKDKWWIFFGGAGDSVEIRVESEGGGSISTNLGEERDSRHNNVGYFRKRLTRSGVIEAWTVLDDANTLGDTVPFTLSFRRVNQETPASFRMTGQRGSRRARR